MKSSSLSLFVYFGKAQFLCSFHFKNLTVNAAKITVIRLLLSDRLVLLPKSQGGSTGIQLK